MSRPAVHDDPIPPMAWLVPLSFCLLVGLVVSGGEIALISGTKLIFPGIVPFALVFPALVLATHVAGVRAGLTVIFVCQIHAWYYLLGVEKSFAFSTPSDAASLVIATFAEFLLLCYMTLYRRSLDLARRLEGRRAEETARVVEAAREKTMLYERLKEQEASLRMTRQNLEAICSASADGLTLCRAIFDDHGNVVDYQVLETNSAHRELTGASRDIMLAKPVSRIAPPVDPRWFQTADRVLKTRVMQHFDVRSPDTGRWLNIRVSPVSDVLFQQTFVDVTDRHLLEDQRRDLMNEMSHRVMNNFQMISSFLHMQSSNADPAVRQQLQTAEQRIQVLAKLHALLAYTDTQRKVELGAYINDLCIQLRSVIDRPAAIRLTCETETLTIDMEKAVPLGLILSELVTNAAKYAFPEPLEGSIRVRLAPEGDLWALSIEDNGRGLSKATDAGEAPQINGGLGTRLVAAFVRQIGGQLVTTSVGGVRHVVRFPPDSATPHR